MGNWRGAWFLVKSEIAWARWKVAFPVFFSLYMMLFMVPLFDDALDGDEMFFSYMTVDLYALLLFPLLGLMATQPYFTWKTDVYTKKLEIWRTLPIPFRQIALGKFLLYLTIGIPGMIIFFTGFYFALRSIGSHQLQLGTYLQFALFWIVYTVIAGFAYLYVEMGYKGRIYFWYCMIVAVTVLIALIVFSIWFKESLMLNSYHVIQNGGWWLPACAIVAAAAVIPLGLRSIERKLRARNLAK